MLVLMQNAVFAAGLLAVSFFIGFSFLAFIGWKKTVFGSVAWGFVALLAVFHIVAYPLFQLKTSFTLLFYCFSAVLAVLLIVSVIISVRCKFWQTIIEEVRRFFAGFKQTPLPVLVLCFAVLLFLYICLFFYTGTSDDSYYLPRAMEILVQNRLDISHSFAWYGREVSVFNDTVDASTLEFFRAYLSRLTSIPVTILCRNGMILALVAISLCCVWTFADSMLADKEHAFSLKTYALILWISFLLLTPTSNSISVFIVRYIWQGKTLMPAVIFPMTFASCATLFKRSEVFRLREWLSMTIVLLAGVSVSIVGVFLPPILYFLLVLSHLIVTRFRPFLRILPGAILSVLPASICVAVTLWQIVTTQSSYFTRFGEVSSWVEKFTFSTDIVFFVIFLICAVYTIVRGSKTERTLFVVMPILLFVTFLNPLFMHFVSTYITTASVYWRLFWMLPVYLAPICMIPSFIFRHIQPKQFEKCLLTTVLSVALMFGSRYTKAGTGGMLTMFLKFTNATAPRTNVYGIYDAHKAAADLILADWEGEDKPLLLFYNEKYRLNEIRQYTVDIALAALMRPTQIEYQTDLIPGTDVRESDFYLNYNEITDGEYLHDMVTRLGIDYVLFYGEPLIQEPEAYGFTELYTGDQVLWRVD